MDQKAVLVFQESNFLSSRKYYNFSICLYYVGSLMVEVWYFEPTTSIERIVTASYNNLYLHTVNMPIGSLLN